MRGMTVTDGEDLEGSLARMEKWFSSDMGIFMLGRVSPCRLLKVGEKFGNHDLTKNNEPKEENEKHCLNEKDRNDMEVEKSDDENDTHHAENIIQYESSSSGEMTPSVRVTKILSK